jgi:acetyl-CoA carboxylase carboxyltransferase component
VEEPLFDPQELGGIIPVDTKKSFDIRKVVGTSIVVIAAR